jgi:hypothetical protein
MPRHGRRARQPDDGGNAQILCSARRQYPFGGMALRDLERIRAVGEIMLGWACPAPAVLASTLASDLARWPDYAAIWHL